MPSTLSIVVALALAMPGLSGRTAPPRAIVGDGRELAHPVVTGAAGPFRHVALTLTRPKGRMGAAFTGMLEGDGGIRLALSGPDQPDDFFLLDPRAVMFAPIDRSGTNGVVILYDSSQIGPDNGTRHLALVYRIDRSRVTRRSAIEARLEGAADARAARARLAGMIR